MKRVDHRTLVFLAVTAVATASWAASEKDGKPAASTASETAPPNASPVPPETAAESARTPKDEPEEGEARPSAFPGGIRLGGMLERADKTTRMLDVKYFILLPSVSDIGTPYDDIQWTAVLKSVSGFEMYRKRFGRISPERIVEFLLLDAEFPRAVRYCMGLADQSLHSITGTRPGAFSCAAEQRIGLLRSELDFAQVDSILKSGLHEFFDALETKMNTIDECILGDFFAQRPQTAGTAG